MNVVGDAKVRVRDQRLHTLDGTFNEFSTRANLKGFEGNCTVSPSWYFERQSNISVVNHNT